MAHPPNRGAHLSRVFLALSILFISLAVTLAATGGFVADVAGVRLSARSPATAAVAGAVALLAWVAVAGRRRAWGADLAAVTAAVERRASAAIVTIALLAGAASIGFGTFSASGADASGYLSEAAMLASGDLSRQEPLAEGADWRDGAASLAPLGWRPGQRPHEQVPTYAVGLPLLMALPHALGGAIAASLVVGGSLVVAVWAAGALALCLGGPLAGVLAALWLATSPVALWGALQPMSDVPVTAAWLLAWLAITDLSLARTGSDPVITRGALLAGAAAALAVLIRPNLAPLAAIPALSLLLLRPSRTNPSPAPTGTDPVDARSRLWLFALPVAAAGAIVALLQWRWFGSPLRSGYGSAAELFTLANIIPNVQLYGRWLIDTHGPWLLAAPVALFWPRIRELRWLLAFAAAVCAAYFVYAIFEDWPYLRFLLPALALAMVGLSVTLAALLTTLPRAAQLPIFLIAALALAASQIASARADGVFRFEARHSRALLAGRYLDSVLPRRAILVTGEQSGAMRYYTNRPVLRWEVLDANALESTLIKLTALGYEPWIALDMWEESPFRDKFRGTVIGALDWPPLLDAGREMRTRAWRLRDRATFSAGGSVHTDRVR